MGGGHAVAVESSGHALVVFINAPMCSRSPPETDENKFDQVVSEHVVNQYDSLAKWKTA